MESIAVSSAGLCANHLHLTPDRQLTTTPAPYHSIIFTGRMLFLTPNQQRQSTEGKCNASKIQFSVPEYLYT